MPKDPLVRYTQGLRRRWWLFPIGLVLALTGAILAAQLSTPRYASAARVLVSTSSGGDERYWNILADQQLAKTYAEVATDRATLTEVASRLQIADPPETLSRDIRVRLIPDTRILEISVERTDAGQAAAIANEIAGSLAAPTGRPGADVRGTQANVQTEINALQIKIRALELDIATLDEQIRVAVSARVDSTALVQRHDTLLTLLTTWQNTLTSLFQTLLRTANDQPVRIVSLASPATGSRSPDIGQRLMISILTGLVLAAAVAILLEAADRNVRYATDLAGEGLPPMLANIPPFQSIGFVQLLRDSPREDEPAGEAFRVLRTAVLASRVAGRATAILVSSSSAGDGSGIVAANLASVLAQSGARVGLIEGNLRRPSLQALFAVESRSGLAELLRLPQVSPARLLVPTDIPGLEVLVRGESSNNPADLLAERGIESILCPLGEQFDFLVITGPPAGRYTDSAIIAAAVDLTLLVIGSGQSTLEEVRRSVDALEVSGGRVAGIVLNRATRPWIAGRPIPRLARMFTHDPSATADPTTEPSTAVVRSR